MGSTSNSACSRWKPKRAPLIRDAPLLTLSGRLAPRSGDVARAEAALQRLTELSPSDAEAYHNLGTVRLELGRLAESVKAYQRALKLRPDYATTHEYLAQAYEGLGRNKLARTHRERAARLAPDLAKGAEQA